MQIIDASSSSRLTYMRLSSPALVNASDQNRKYEEEGTETTLRKNQGRDGEGDAI